MEITNSLIRKFFANQCDPLEFEAVMAYLELHPELSAKELGLEEWKTTDPSSPGNTDHQDEALRQLKERLFPQTGRRIRRMRWTAVAASLLLIAGGWIFIAKNKTRNTPPLIASAPVQQQRQGQANWKTLRNTTGKTENIVLPDGSHAKLYAHSALRYTDSFGISRRDSWLEGGAEFDVKKDRSHPFTVYAAKLATTALGTTFGITAGGIATIKLYSGRVVVRSIQPLSGWSRDVYLSPGQQVSYDSHRLLATLSKFETGTAASAAATDSKELVFNNSSLKEVFQRLSIQYHKKFTFRAKDLAGLNFTGTVPRTDSLDVFLRLLAGMNNLDIREQPAGYTVSRHKE